MGMYSRSEEHCSFLRFKRRDTRSETDEHTIGPELLLLTSEQIPHLIPLTLLSAYNLSSSYLFSSLHTVRAAGLGLTLSVCAGLRQRRCLA